MAWKVWFVPAQPNHVAKFQPVMDELRRRDCEIRVLCVDEAISKPKHIRHMLKDVGWDFEMLRCDRFVVTGRWPIDFIQKAKLRRCVRRWMASRDVDLLVLGTDSPIVTREIVKEAQCQHVPRVYVHDGICGGRNPRRNPGLLLRVRQFLSIRFKKTFDMRSPRGPRSADIFFLMDRSSIQTMLKQGVPRSRLKVAGSPQLDALVRAADRPVPEEELQRIRDKVGAGPDRPILLYAHQHIVYPRATTEELIRRMVAGLRRCNGTLLVKFHPSSGERVPEWQAWARAEGFDPEEVVFALAGLLSPEAVRVCHTCVTAYSTVALEAMIAHKPVILMQYLPVPHFINWGETYGAAYDVFSHEELQQAVFEVMVDPDVRRRLLRNADECLRQEFGGLDGKSTERMGNYLLDLMRSYKEKE